MLLGINKEDVKDATQIETKWILSVKMSFLKVYSWSHSHSTSRDYSRVIAELSQVAVRGKLLCLVTQKLGCMQGEPKVLAQGWNHVQQELLWTLNFSWSSSSTTPSPASALTSSNSQQQHLYTPPLVMGPVQPQPCIFCSKRMSTHF